MRRMLMMLLGVVLVSSTAWAYRSKRPQAFTDLTNTNQLVELNNVLSDLWNLTNGRYTLENLITNPQDVRKGTKGDLVYATFGGNDHLCVSTSFPEGKDWTCVNVGTLSTCPGGADTQVQFNDNGNCGGDVQFSWDKNSNTLLVNGTVGIGGDVTAPSADLEIDPTNVTGLTVNNSAFLSDNQVFWLNSGVTVPSQFQNQFLAPTINGVSGAPTETVTNAATVYINEPPKGTNISMGAYELLFGNNTDSGASLPAYIKVMNEPTVNTDGRGFIIEAGKPTTSGTGDGGSIELDATSAGFGTNTGAGGYINLFAGNNAGTNYGGEI